MGPKRSIRVLIVDDHPMVREGLRSMLSVPEIEVVGEGESVLDPAVLKEAVAGTERRPPAAATLEVEPLTRIETEVLRLLAAGLTNREISERLRWSLGTAKKYVQRVLEKLQVSDRTQAAVEAVRRGLVGP